MTEELSKEDQDWLEALSGASCDGADPSVLAQASAVRQALAARREAIELDAMSTGDRGLDAIRARLQREHLMDSADSSVLKAGWLARIRSVLGVGASGGGMNLAPIWGVAATLMLAVFVTFQLQGPQQKEDLVYRGDANITTLIVENPQARADELVAGIEAVSSDSVEVTHLEGGRLQLRIRDSEHVQDYLLEQRIDAIAIEGIVTINVVPETQ